MKTRNKLMAAIVMLLVSAVMLSTASYAWFTISTAPEVKGLTTQVVVNENLEIALANGTTLPGAVSATGNYYTWGNFVDLTGTTSLTGSGSGTNEYTTFMAGSGTPVALRPATYATAAGTPTGATAAGFIAPQYGADGRIDTGKWTTLTAVATNTNGFGTIADASGKVYGYYVDYWFRTNVAGDLKLTTAADRINNSDGNASANTGSGSTITIVDNNSSAQVTLKNNLKVGFEVKSGLAADGTTALESLPTGIVFATNNASDDEKVNNLVCNDIFTMTANCSYIVRCYIYLEGESVTNAAASIDGTTISAAVNLQFAINDVDNPMLP